LAPEWKVVSELPMAIRVALHHRTEYRYDRAVNSSPHVIRLRPAPHCRTQILAYSLAVEPQKHFFHWHQDPFGNFLARLVFPEQSDRLWPRSWATPAPYGGEHV
jgi:transglutaminase-like putative cysteine protease